jgi:hypothetical protein
MTAATQVCLQPSEGATGWGAFLPGGAPPHFATPFLFAAILELDDQQI